MFIEKGDHMEKYNYREAVKEDVKNFIENEIDYQAYESVEELKEFLNEILFKEIKGNTLDSSVVYRQQAEECLAHNLDLLYEVLSEFGEDIDALKQGAEYCDVKIRCYLLPEAIDQVVDDLEIEQMIDPVSISI